MNTSGSYWQALRRNRLLWNIALIAAIMLALALAAHFLMQIGTRHGARRTVPDFAGVPFAEAQRLAAGQSLVLHINDSLFVPAYEGGIVLDQLPEAGVEVKPGRTVYVTINSYRQKRAQVPYVAGRSLRQAKNMLEIAGFAIERLVYRPDMATNYVLDEEFDGHRITASSSTEAEIGSGVVLHVGLGGEGGMTVVPQTVGLSLHEAKSRLWEQGLNIGRVAFDNGINLLNQKDARVYIQTPSAERAAAFGAEVELRLTLDAKKLDETRARAEKEARRMAEERQAAEELRRESLEAAAAALPPAPSDENPSGEPAETPAKNTDDEFFF